VRLLLDTDVLLWFMAADRRLGARARSLIEEPANTVMVSIVSLWEIALKSRLGKLRIDLDAALEAIGRTDIEHLDLKEGHLRVLARLRTIVEHRDPFDHLLIAQAQAEDLTFMSNDGWVRRYPVRHESSAASGPA
jgi:PIN domain nuclease of toxin-antitoxin system